jgi:hypothetical protein
MSNPFLRLTVSAIAVLSLPGCAEIPDYSPHYAQIPLYSAKPPHRVVSYQLVPEACLTPDPTDTQLGPRLPPGCANNANLLAMVERKRDVVQGRAFGRSPASPSARAAQRYIYGTSPALGGGGPSIQPSVSGTVTNESVPALTTSASSQSR